MRCVAFLIAMLAQFSCAGDVSGMVIRACWSMLRLDHFFGPATPSLFLQSWPHMQHQDTHSKDQERGGGEAGNPWPWGPWGPQSITTWDQRLPWPWLCFWFFQNFIIHLLWVDHVNTLSRVPIFVFLPWVYFVSKSWWTGCSVASLAPSVSKIRSYKTWESLVRKSDWLLINQWHEKSVGIHQIPIFLICSWKYCIDKPVVSILWPLSFCSQVVT